ncbi:casein kinase 1-like protein 3 [Tanacetum coccineum]
MVVDEGHQLKNSESLLAKTLVSGRGRTADHLPPTPCRKYTTSNSLTLGGLKWLMAAWLLGCFNSIQVIVLSETPKTRYDPIQKAAKSENSLKLNNNTFEKSKLEFVAMYYRYTDELPVSSEGATLNGEDDLVSMWKEYSGDLKDCLRSVVLLMATHVDTHEIVVVKMSKQPQLLYEAKLYKYLQRLAGVAAIHWSGIDVDDNVLVLDLLGSVSRIFSSIVDTSSLSILTELQEAGYVVGRSSVHSSTVDGTIKLAHYAAHSVLLGTFKGGFFRNLRGYDIAEQLKELGNTLKMSSSGPQKEDPNKEWSVNDFHDLGSKNESKQQKSAIKQVKRVASSRFSLLSSLHKNGQDKTAYDMGIQNVSISQENPFWNYELKQKENECPTILMLEIVVTGELEKKAKRSPFRDKIKKELTNNGDDEDEWVHVKNVRERWSHLSTRNAIESWLEIVYFISMSEKSDQARYYDAQFRMADLKFGLQKGLSSTRRMATFELYRRSTIGMCLTDTLDEMVSTGKLGHGHVS